MKTSLSTVRNASHLLPTGGELVRDLADEIELLRDELERRDEVLESRRLTLVDLTHKASIRKNILEHSEWCMRWNQQNSLAAVKNEFQRIHDDLRLEGVTNV